jgi:DNA-binding transcriptional regulator YhcF (GntR family)
MATKQIQGDIDTTYYTQQRDIFTSGLAADIGVSAFAVWHAIKWHADFNTGESYPGIRRLAEITGTAPMTVQTAIKVLVEKHLLRIRKVGQKNVYVARERIDVRVGNRVISTIVVDFIPDQMRERLARLKAAGGGDLAAADVWAQVDLLPGPGMVLDKATGTFSGSMRADEVPEQMPSHATKSVANAKDALRQIADQLRVTLKN